MFVAVSPPCRICDHIADFELSCLFEWFLYDLDTLKAQQRVCEDEEVFADRKLHDAQRE